MPRMSRVACGLAALILLVLGTPLHIGRAAEPAVYPGKSWQIKAPAEVGFDAAPLAAMAESVGGDGCLVRHGYLAFSWGEPAKRRDIASACKPFYTHFLFRAIEEGRLAGVDAVLVDFEPGLRELNPALDHKDRRITWKHLAYQTSCYGVTEAPGEAFDYSDFNMALFADTLFLHLYGATWDKVDEQAFHRLLTDILQCQDNPSLVGFGVDHHPGRVKMSARDHCRFGLLYLRGGRWGEKQLLTAEHVKQIVGSPLDGKFPRTRGEKAEMLPGQRTIGGGNNQTDHNGSYSFAWWTNGIDREGKRHWPEAPLDTFAALGHGGKRGVAVLPSLDVVISWNETKIDGREKLNDMLRQLVAAATP